MKIQKKIFFLGGGVTGSGGGVRGGGGSGCGGQGGCDRRIEVFGKIQKKIGGGGSGGGGGFGWWGDQGGCEQRIEVFVKIQKKIIIYLFFYLFFMGGGVRVDVNEELRFL